MIRRGRVISIFFIYFILHTYICYILLAVLFRSKLWCVGLKHKNCIGRKVETILKRGELNTRSRDFYDVYILTKTQSFDRLVLKESMKLKTVNPKKKKRWGKYTKDYRYAEDIEYSHIIDALRALA